MASPAAQPQAGDATGRAFPVPLNFATKLQNARKDVNFLTYFLRV